MWLRVNVARCVAWRTCVAREIYLLIIWCCCCWRISALIKSIIHVAIKPLNRCYRICGTVIMTVPYPHVASWKVLNCKLLAISYHSVSISILILCRGLILASMLIVTYHAQWLIIVGLPNTQFTNSFHLKSLLLKVLAKVCPIGHYGRVHQSMQSWDVFASCHITLQYAPLTLLRIEVIGLQSSIASY